MNKEQLINNCISVLGGTQDTNTIDLLVQSALAFVNSYTFQSYSFDEPDRIPQDIFFALMDLVKFKMTQKIGVQSERLSDFSITYTNEQIPSSVQVLLDRYRDINVI